MKKCLMMMAVCVIAAASFGAYTENFETFPIESPLVNPPAASNWTVFTNVNSVNTVTSGEYTGGIAIQKVAAFTDIRFSNLEAGVNFGLALDGEAIEYGFDWNEASTSLFNAKMYLRQGATGTYAPSFGINSGIMRLRPYGEDNGTGEIFGTNFSSGTIHGVYWSRGTNGNPGHWLRFRLRLSGPNFNIATVYCYNLTTGVEIPTGIVNHDMGRNIRSIAGGLNRFYLRTHSQLSWLDNMYVKDAYPEGIVAAYPSPANGASNVSIMNTALSWTAYPGATAQRVYFGTNADLAETEFKGEQTAETFALGTLATDSTYYWRVDQVYGGNVYEGEVWSFTTHGQLLAYEGFDYIGEGSLNDPRDNGGYGWASSWQREAGGWCYVTIVNGSIETDFFYSHTPIGQKISFDNSAAPDQNDAKRQLNVPVDLDDDATYYFSYLASADNDLENALNFELFETKTSEPWLSVGMLYEGYPNVTSPKFRLRDNDATWVPYMFGSWQSGQASLVVIKIVTSSTGNDTVYASVYNSAKPVPQGEPAVWDASFSYDGSGVLSWIGIDGRANSTIGEYQIDEIRYGLSWDVTAGSAEIIHPRVMAYEGFDYPQYLQLSQNNGGNGGFGWDGSWERAAGGWCYVTVGPGSLQPAMDYLLGTQGNKVQAVAGGVNGDGMRKLEYPIDLRVDKDYYISYLAMGDSDTYNAITFGLFEEKNGAFLFQSHMYYKDYIPAITSPQFSLRDDMGNYTNKLFGSWTSGEVYVIVVKISSSTSGNDTVSMSVFSPSNPLPVEEPAVWDKSFTTQSNKVYPWVYINGRADSFDQWNVDEIHIGTGWGAVTGWASACGDFGTIMPYDLNEDCTIDYGDYAVIANDWLKCTDPAIDGCEWALTPNDPNNSMLFTVMDAPERKVYEVSGVTVDGDLADWDGSRWYNSRFTSGFNAANVLDIADVKFSLKWDPANPQYVYAAVKVTDTNQSFAAAPTLWNSGDNIEIRFTANDTSTDVLWYDNSTFDTAQYYQLFPLSPSGAYSNFGPINVLRDAGVYSDIEYAIVANGDEIVYEMAIPAYLAYNIGTQSGTMDTLADGDVIAFNIQINSVNGEVSGGLFNDQSRNPQDWAKFTITANSSLALGDMGFFAADLDRSGTVGLSDLKFIFDKWLSCTDPEIVGCDQPWLP